MTNSHTALRLMLAVFALSVNSCAPTQPPEDPDGTNVTDPSARDSSGQSYAEAIAIMCDADRLSGAQPSDPLQAATTRDEYLVGHVKNADGIYFLTLFRSKAGPEQADALACQAEASKLAKCALVDTLRSDG